MRKKISEKQMEELSKITGYFKLNLPADFKGYQQGNGEGIWAVCLKKDKQKLNSNISKGQFIAWASNDSIYYPEICCGSEILAEFRGNNRPVAVWDDLQGTKEAAKNRAKIMKRLRGQDESA